MKKAKKIQKQILNELVVFPKLIWEIILFTLHIPHYFYLFFHGLRITSDSYSKLLDAISSRKNTIDNLFKKNIDSQETTKIFRALLNQLIELKQDQDRLYAGILGVFIAILALFISII